MSTKPDQAHTALDLLTAVEGPLVRVTADAASDTVAVYETTGARGATVVVPPARTANVSGHGPRSPRYCQKLWMGLAQAASFLMPSTKGTPLMTSTIN